MSAIYVHKWDGSVRYVVTQDEELVAKCATDRAAIDTDTIYFYAESGWSELWRCEAHNVTTYSDCPRCDAELIGLADEQVPA